MVTVTGAHTTFPNTPETDAMPTVWHTVSYSDSSGESRTAYLRAKDPSTAISMAKRLDETQLLTFDKKPVSN